MSILSRHKSGQPADTKTSSIKWRYADVINLRIEKKKKRKVKHLLGAAAAVGGRDRYNHWCDIIFHGRKKNEMTKKNKQQRKRAHFDIYKERGNIAGGWRQLKKSWRINLWVCGWSTAEHTDRWPWRACPISIRLSLLWQKNSIQQGSIRNTHCEESEEDSSQERKGRKRSAIERESTRRVCSAALLTGEPAHRHTHRESIIFYLRVSSVSTLCISYSHWESYKWSSWNAPTLYTVYSQSSCLTWLDGNAHCSLL